MRIASIALLTAALSCFGLEMMSQAMPAPVSRSSVEFTVTRAVPASAPEQLNDSALIAACDLTKPILSRTPKITASALLAEIQTAYPNAQLVQSAPSYTWIWVMEIGEWVKICHERDTIVLDDASNPVTIVRENRVELS